jgi:hypothetical protein
MADCGRGSVIAISLRGSLCPTEVNLTMPHGRIVKTTGDSMLVEFGALRCCLEGITEGTALRAAL